MSALTQRIGRPAWTASHSSPSTSQSLGWTVHRQATWFDRHGTTRAASTTGKKRLRTALFFPGQGVQRVGMATDWLEAFPGTVKPILEEIDETLKTPLSRIIAEGPNSVLTATENAQPAIMATSIIIMRVLEHNFGFTTEEKVDVTLGHSLGEFAALVAGGYLRWKDALLMTRRRAEVMAQCSKAACEASGGEVGMIALVCDEGQRDAMVKAIHDFLGHSTAGEDLDGQAAGVAEVHIANINSKNQIVLSGAIDRIKTLLTHLSSFGGHDPRAVRLKADSPFHSPLMTPAVETMNRILARPSTAAPGEDVVIFPGLMPCISNVTGRPFNSREDLKDQLARQAVATVQWHDSIQYLHQQERVKRWIGIGPGKVGRNLVGKEVGMKGAVKGGGVWGINDPREIENIVRELEETEFGTSDEPAASST